MDPDTLDPRVTRAAMMLTALGLALSVAGAVMLARPEGYAVVTLPAAAFCVVLWRSWR